MPPNVCQHDVYIADDACAVCAADRVAETLPPGMRRSPATGALISDAEYRAFVECIDKVGVVIKLEDTARLFEGRADYVGGPERDALNRDIRRLDRERNRLLDNLSRSPWLSDVHRFLIRKLHSEVRRVRHDLYGATQLGSIRQPLDVVYRAQWAARIRSQDADLKREYLATATPRERVEDSVGAAWMTGAIAVHDWWNRRKNKRND